MVTINLHQGCAGNMKELIKIQKQALEWTGYVSRMALNSCAVLQLHLLAHCLQGPPSGTPLPLVNRQGEGTIIDAAMILYSRPQNAGVCHPSCASLGYELPFAQRWGLSLLEMPQFCPLTPLSLRPLSQACDQHTRLI